MNKGERTRKDIIEKAFAMAGNVGLEGVSLGTLAGETGLSKSGLFAHFKSKEALQLSVIEEVIERFTKNVIRPAIGAPRGEARIRTYFDAKLDWIAVHRSNGGCFYLALCQEYSHREGPVKDRLIQGQNDLMETISRFVRTAIEEGEFREDVDPVRFAFELEGITMAYSHIGKFVQTPQSLEHARLAFEDLIRRSRATG
jgi:AcrR family transcriptional regulator